MLRLPRVTVALAAGLLFATGCGGSSSLKPAAQTGANGQTSSSSSSSDASRSSSDGAAGGTGGLPDSISDASYNRGTGHVEISGAKSASADFNTAAGLTTQGHTFVTFTDEANTSSLTLTVSKTETESGVAVNVNGLATGGGFGDACHIDVNKNDASELSGSFTCAGVDGVGGADVFTGNLNVKGTFSAKA